MCLITAKQYDEGTMLGIELKTPFLTGLTHLEGKVLESKEKIRDIIYETRLEFQDLCENSKNVLEKTIEHFENETENNNE